MKEHKNIPVSSERRLAVFDSHRQQSDKPEKYQQQNLIHNAFKVSRGNRFLKYPIVSSKSLSNYFCLVIGKKAQR